MKKYGKKSADVLCHKSSFFSDNDSKLEHFRKLYNNYISQPRRTECKNCKSPIAEISFKKMGVDYLVCPNCSHLNGAHQDTDEFCAALYTDNEGKSYAVTYDSTSKDEYKKRVKDIYSPKVDFLMDSLKEHSVQPNKLKYADFGAGSGYFVSALKNQGLECVSGYEVSASQVDLANNMLANTLIIKHELEEIESIASKVSVDLISLIGVLEHVQNPRQLLKAISSNPNVEYLYFSVPLFSICVFFEHVFGDVMPRHLAPAHTHLYTEDSIKYFCEEFGFEIISEWWFGSDMVDLYRSVLVTLEKTNGESKASEIWENMFKPLIDDLQVAQDRKHAASEVHMLLRKKK